METKNTLKVIMKRHKNFKICDVTNSILSKLNKELDEFKKLVSTMSKYDEKRKKKSKLIKEELNGVIRGIKISIEIVKNISHN